MHGLYIHIPFCKSICPYCDFYKMVVSNELQDKYLDSLKNEFNFLNLQDKKYDTIYLGGGTPSALSLKSLENLLMFLNNHLDLKNLKEFTIEVNPQDITLELLNLLRKYNLTRISIGIQTLNPRLQKMINRPFSYDDLTKKIRLLNQIGFSNYSFDVIYGLPTQDKREVIEDLEKLIKLNPKHLSCYSLILEEHTILYKEVQDQKISLLSDDDLRLMYEEIKIFLTGHGFEQYEISNYSLPGFESLHNLLYWNQDTYDALGISAASFDGITRRKLSCNLNTYLNDFNLDNYLKYYEEDVLSKEDLIDEFIMLNLRKTEGFEIGKFNTKFKVDLFEYYPSIVNLINDGYLKLINGEENRILVNQDFLYVSEEIVLKILNSHC